MSEKAVADLLIIGWVLVSVVAVAVAFGPMMLAARRRNQYGTELPPKYVGKLLIRLAAVLAVQAAYCFCVAAALSLRGYV